MGAAAALAADPASPAPSGVGPPKRRATHYTAAVGIRAVCFDLGGVIVRIHRTWEAAVTFAGFTRGTPAQWTDPRVVEAWQLVHVAHHRGEVTDAAYFDRVAQLSGGFYEAEDVARIHRGWLIEEYPGMADLVWQLGKAGLVTACLSNTNEHHWQSLLTEPCFPSVQALQVKLASHRLKMMKPEAGIYVAAESALGCASDEIAFFDDLSENVEAARQRGWNTRLIDPMQSPAEQVVTALRAWGVRLEGTDVGG